MKFLKFLIFIILLSNTVFAQNSDDKLAKEYADHIKREREKTKKRVYKPCNQITSSTIIPERGQTIKQALQELFYSRTGDIMHIQKALNECGYAVKIDGIWGPETRNAYCKELSHTFKDSDYGVFVRANCWARLNFKL